LKTSYERTTKKSKKRSKT